MISFIPMRRVLRGALAMPLLAFVMGSSPHADDNLPVYTSPIDITGGRIQFRTVVPDRDSGKPVEMPLPPGLLPPGINRLTGTPLSTQMDQFWNVTPDPATGRTPRQQACDGEQGIKRQVQDAVRKIGASFSAYDISCNLATTGMVLVRQVGSMLYVSYQLLNNTVDFFVTTPLTCHRDRGTFLCPNDPQFSVRFASEIWTVVRTPDLCHMVADGGTANLHAVQIDSHNASGDIVRNIADPLFLGNKFTAAELAIQAVERATPMPLDNALRELRESTGCTDRSSPAGRAIAAFPGLETVVRPPEGIIFRITHPAIAAPRFQNVSLPYGPDTCLSGFVWREAYDGDHVCVTPATRAQAAADNAQAASRRSPTGGPYGPETCKTGFVWREARPEDRVCVTPETRSQTAADNAQASKRRVLDESQVPSFTRPNITAQPVVVAGNSVKVNGQFFPRGVDPTILPLSLERDTTSACNGGATELEWGTVGGQMRVDKLPPSGNISSCASRYEVKGLTPATAYQFRARDCDAFTCSPWSTPLRIATGASTPGQGQVQLKLDDGPTLGTATVDDKGAFEAAITVPAGTSAGTHRIQAISGDARAEVSLQVTAPGGGKAAIVLTGSYFGETGCPTHPLPDYAQSITIDQTFPLFGSGFALGMVTIRMDSVTGTALGTATVREDGSFCQEFQGPPESFLGQHTLVAEQNGTAQATIPVKVIRPYIVR